MTALTKLDLSHAYPFMSLSFALVALASAWVFPEPLTGPKIAGVVLICLGVAIGSQG
jgi:multidrug transporter EmrE-like cation transporter